MSENVLVSKCHYIKYHYSISHLASIPGKTIVYSFLDKSIYDNFNLSQAILSEADSCSLILDDNDNADIPLKLCEKLYSVWHKLDTDSSILPIIFELTDNRCNTTSCFIYDDKVTCETWKKIIAEGKGKLLFCSQPIVVDNEKYPTGQNTNEIKFSFVTDDKAKISEWLKTNTDQSLYKLKVSAKYDTRIRMINWYGSENAKKIMEDSENELTKFVLAVNFGIYIPNFLTVPCYHAKRYQQALDILEHVYHPEFIMTLPLVSTGIKYTILFPVTEKLTRDKFNAKRVFEDKE